jgi:hypothetical protein
MRNRHEHEREQKKIECIQRPTEEAGQERPPLIVIKRLEKTNRFHADSTNCRLEQSRDFSEAENRGYRG